MGNYNINVSDRKIIRDIQNLIKKQENIRNRIVDITDVKKQKQLQDTYILYDIVKNSLRQKLMENARNRKGTMTKLMGSPIMVR